MKFEVYTDAAGEFRWRLKAANGEPIASSGEGYKSKDSALHAIDLIKKGAADAPIVDITSES